MLPLQTIDGILIGYNLGQVLFLGFVLTTLGALPLKSQRVIALNTMLFGLIFIAAPLSIVPEHYLFLGIALCVIGPMLYATSR
ncbi:hypothetical protein ACNS7O_03590 [Haloferacaceae archaeon DSL9]